MSDKYAEVQDPSYTFGGARLGRGTVVRLTAAQMKETEHHDPPRLKEVSEPKEGMPVVDIRPTAVLRQPEVGIAPERPSPKTK